MRNLTKLNSLARIGFAARGVMYLLIGLLALWSGRSEDGAGALQPLGSGLGRILLAVMALGFLGYALWRLAEAAVDAEGKGEDAKGVILRLGGAISGLVHLSLFAAAAKLALGNGGGGSSGARQSAATALDLPGGALLLGAAALGLAVTGIVQLVRAAKASFLKNLDSRAAKRAWVEWLGRAGYAARGIVFLMIGWFLLSAATEHDAAEAGGIGAALESLSPDLRTAVAAGLLLFGLFSLVEARFRRIADPHVGDRLASQGARLQRHLRAMRRERRALSG